MCKKVKKYKQINEKPYQSVKTSSFVRNLTTFSLVIRLGTMRFRTKKIQDIVGRINNIADFLSRVV